LSKLKFFSNLIPKNSKNEAAVSRIFIRKSDSPLFQKQEHLPFKQGYDNLRLFRRESALLSDTAQRERHKCRNQCAVYTSLNVPPDTVPHLVFFSFVNTRIVLICYFLTSLLIEKN
jgi:hypothetical protein